MSSTLFRETLIMPQYLMNDVRSLMVALAIACCLSPAAGDENRPTDRFQLTDVFELEYASDPQIAPDGRRIVYVRNSMDIMTDKVRSRLWIVDDDGRNHRALTSWSGQATEPRWSPDGKRLAYVVKTEDGSQIAVRWMESGQTARLTNVRHSPRHLSWSPTGDQLAFVMLVLSEEKPFVEMPKKPQGAVWAESAKVIDTLVYRSDGQGYLQDGYFHVFVLPSEGGTPRQVTSGSFHHTDKPHWDADGRSLVFSANRDKNWPYHPLNSELHQVDLSSGKITALTDRDGPDNSPVLSADGRQLAWIGFDDQQRSYHQSELYVMDRDGNNRRIVTDKFDRAVREPSFSSDGQKVFFLYDDQGTTKLGRLHLATGELQTLAEGLGGTTLGRPYASGSYSVATDGQVALTKTTPHRPADVAAVVPQKPGLLQLTYLNEDLLAHKQLGEIESFRFRSSHDQREIHGWILKPPGFDPHKKYPLLLEIHGGPFANYGDRFAAEFQLYAAAGYVVIYINPRGSTSYGSAFAELIDHNYPSQDYDDLISGVDAVIQRGYIDPQALYVTGGSGGGVLSSWIIGQTDRFRAAVVVKPVINWYSFVLTADHYNYFARYWFGEFPWENPEGYLKRSPISLVGQVSTPTMLMTGEVDYRTPISETEQYYQALKLRKVETVLVRIPGASHSIAARPSHLIAKVAHVLKWFKMHPRP